MAAVLAELLQLFEIDKKLVALKRQLDLGPKRIKAEESGIGAAREEMRAAEAVVKQKSTELDQCNLDIRSAESEIDDQQDKLKVIKNNKEYRIVTERIKDLKQTIETKEAQVLNIMEELDGLRAAFKEKRSTVEEAEARIAALRAETEESTVGIREEAQGLKAQRTAQVARVHAADANLVAVYSTALRRGQGIGLAELDGGVCQECYRQASPNMASNAAVGRDIARCICAGCGRILYTKQAVESEAARE